MVTTGVRRIFVDTNVVTRSIIASAPLYKEVRQRLDQFWAEDVELCISHQVIREYMVNATRSQTYGPALSMTEVLGHVEYLQEVFHILHDTPETLAKLLELASRTTMNGKHIHDANIVATMLAHNIKELFTNNVGDFARYQHLITIIPL